MINSLVMAYEDGVDGHGAHTQLRNQGVLSAPTNVALSAFYYLEMYKVPPEHQPTATYVTYLRVALMPRRFNRRPEFAFKSQLQKIRVVIVGLATNQQRVEYHPQAVDIRRLRQWLKKGRGLWVKVRSSRF